METEAWMSKPRIRHLKELEADLILYIQKDCFSLKKIEDKIAFLEMEVASTAFQNRFIRRIFKAQATLSEVKEVLIRHLEHLRKDYINAER